MAENGRPVCTGLQSVNTVSISLNKAERDATGHQPIADIFSKARAAANSMLCEREENGGPEKQSTQPAKAYMEQSTKKQGRSHARFRGSQAR